MTPYSIKYYILTCISIRFDSNFDILSIFGNMTGNMINRYASYFFLFCEIYDKLKKIIAVFLVLAKLR